MEKIREKKNPSKWFVKKMMISHLRKMGPETRVSRLWRRQKVSETSVNILRRQKTENESGRHRPATNVKRPQGKSMDYGRKLTTGKLQKKKRKCVNI